MSEVHVKSDDREASIWVDDRLQLRAVHVGKGIEVTMGTELNGWILARDMRLWCKRVAKLAKKIEARYDHVHDLYMAHGNCVACRDCDFTARPNR